MRKIETLILLSAATFNGICINIFGFVTTADIICYTLLIGLFIWLLTTLARAIKEFRGRGCSAMSYPDTTFCDACGAEIQSKDIVTCMDCGAKGCSDCLDCIGCGATICDVCNPEHLCDNL